jgi:hypothetical protein
MTTTLTDAIKGGSVSFDDFSLDDVHPDGDEAIAINELHKVCAKKILTLEQFDAYIAARDDDGKELDKEKDEYSEAKFDSYHNWLMCELDPRLKAIDLPENAIFVRCVHDDTERVVDATMRQDELIEHMNGVFAVQSAGTKLSNIDKAYFAATGEYAFGMTKGQKNTLRLKKKGRATKNKNHYQAFMRRVR